MWAGVAQTAKKIVYTTILGIHMDVQLLATLDWIYDIEWLYNVLLNINTVSNKIYVLD